MIKVSTVSIEKSDCRIASEYNGRKDPPSDKVFSSRKLKKETVKLSMNKVVRKTPKKLVKQKQLFKLNDECITTRVQKAIPGSK